MVQKGCFKWQEMENAQGQCLNNVDILSCNVYCLSLLQLVSLMERHQDSMEGDSFLIFDGLVRFFSHHVAGVHSYVILALKCLSPRLIFAYIDFWNVSSGLVCWEATWATTHGWQTLGRPLTWFMGVKRLGTAAPPAMTPQRDTTMVCLHW